jgi:AhpD family alkylhydroperoxidase
MARIEGLRGGRAPWLLRVINVYVRRLLGQEAVPFNVMAHNPRFLLPYLLMSVFAQGKSRLDPQTRLLAIHRVSELNGCSWCLDYGEATADKMGISQSKLQALHSHRSSPLFNDRERAAIDFAEAVTQVGARVDDDLFARLRAQLSEREIVELLAAVAAENFFNRFNAALEIESQGFCALPQVKLDKVA